MDRRVFLKSLAGIAAAAVVPTQVLEPTVPVRLVMYESLPQPLRTFDQIREARFDLIRRHIDKSVAAMLQREDERIFKYLVESMEAGV